MSKETTKLLIAYNISQKGNLEIKSSIDASDRYGIVEQFLFYCGGAKQWIRVAMND